MTRRAAPLALSCLVALAVSAPAGAENGWRDLNHALVEGHIVPRYRLLEQATRGLETRLRLLCEQPSETALAQARQGLISALDAWNGISHIRFGPIETEQRWYRFQLWPDKRGTGPRQVQRMLADADPARLAPDALAKESVGVQGLVALEILLFPESRVSIGDFATGQGPSYRCAFARAIGANLSTMASATLADWTQGKRPYVASLLDPGPGETLGATAGAAPAAGADAPQAGGQTPFGDARSVSAELLKSLGTGVQAVHQQKLLEPLGPSAEQARPRRAESWRSRRSLANVCTDLRALEHLYSTGFSPLLREDPDSAEQELGLALTFASAIQACLSQAADALDGPIEPEATTEPTPEMSSRATPGPETEPRPEGQEGPGIAEAPPISGQSEPALPSASEPSVGESPPWAGMAQPESPPWADMAQPHAPPEGTPEDEAERQRQALEGLRDLVGALQNRTGRRLAEALDLKVGFNSLDGD